MAEKYYVSSEELLKRRNKKKEEEEKKTFVSSEELLQRRAFINSLPKRVESLQTDSQSVYDAYKSRFFDENDKYKNTYRGDTKEAYDTYGAFKSKYDTESKEILNYLDKYGSQLDEKYVTNIKDWLTSNSENLGKIHDAYQFDHKTFSQYKNEDAYNEAVKAQKVREEQLVFDTKKGQEELEAYEEILKNVSRAEMLLNQYKGKELTPNDVPKEEWERYLENKSWIDQYGSAEEIQTEVNKKRAYLQQAKWVQENANLNNVGNPESDVYDSNFDLYVEKGNAIPYVEVGEKKRHRAPGGKGRVSTTSIDNERAAALALYEHNGGTIPSSYDHNNNVIDPYRLMEDEEFKTLAYWMGYDKEHGTNKTEEYLDVMELTLADRKSDEIVEDVKGLELAFGIVAGLDQFASGVENLFNTEDDYTVPSAVQLASGKVRENLAGDEDGFKIFGNSLGQIGYDFITTTTNMVPSILASAAVGTVSKTAGAALGASLMGASSAGNAYADMLNAGYSKDQARTYSTLVGLSESGLQYALGGISKLGSGAVSKFTSKTLGGIAKGINNASIQFAVQYGGEFVGKLAQEGIEEGLQEVLDPFFRSIATGEKPEGVDWEQVAYSGMLGALSAGLLEGGGSIGARVSEIGKAKAIKNEGNVETLKNVGKTFSADSIAYKIADKVTEKTGAYKLSMLLHDVNANLSEQNVQDIEKALVDNGIAKENAKSIAKWLGKAVDGGKLNKAQQMALEDNPIISQVFREVIIDKNSTVNQRLQGVMELNGIKGQAGVDLDALKESATNKEAISDSVNADIIYKDRLKRMAEATAREQSGLISVADIGTESMLDSLINDVSAKVDAIKLENAIEKAYKSKTPIENAIREGNKVSEENGVAVKKITEIGNDGKMMVQTDDGTVEDANDIQFKSNDDAYIILATSDMATKFSGLGIDLDVTSANAVVNGFSPDSGISAIDYMSGAEAAIRYGVIGQKRNTITKDSPYHNLTKSQQDYLYKIGRDIAENTTNKEESKVKARETSTSKKSKNGKVTKAFKSKLKPNQATAISTVEKLSEVGILKNNFYFFESVKGRVLIDGKYQNAMVFATDVGTYKKGTYAPNGFYQNANGDIYIDINSGASGEGFTFYTLAHELGHFVKNENPRGFKVLADFVASELGGNFETLIQDKLDLWKKLGRTEFGYMDAYEDVICDALEPMFTDGNLAERLVEKSKSSIEGKGLLKTLKKFFSDLYARIQKAYAKLEPEDPAAVEMKKHQKAVGELADLFAKAIVGANENFVKSSDIVEDAKPISPDEIITDGATVTAEDGSKFSLRSIKEDIADGQMFEDLKTYCGWSQERVSNLKAQLESLVEYMTPYRDILDMNEVYGREGRRFSPYKPNSDPLYKISLDFSTLCSKRLLTQYVIEQLQLRENRPMSAEEQMAIRDMLKEYGKREKALQVACVMCYVEAARLKSPKQINKWLNDPATQMRNYFADKNPDFSQYIKDAQADFKASKGYSRNATKKEMSAKDVKALNQIRPKLRANYKPTAEESAIIEQAKALPNSTYLTAGNLADLSESHPEIYKAYTAFIRTATRSKSLETDEPYYYGDSRRDNGNGIIVSDSFIEAVNRENGMRFSSWSDWRIQHLLDYIVAVIDNSVRGAAMHGYTKFGDEIRVLGKTGMMFNMSGVPGTQNGLNEDGSLSFSDTESMDYNEAIALREEFPETAGLQCIGVSKEHIIALLRDPIIDYVIPYHVSGLNATLRRMGDIYGWADFTHSQHATEDKSIKMDDAIDKEHWHIEPVFSEFFVGYDTNLNGVEAMKKSADNYIRMCKERGLKPKFEEFTNEENYWKLLIDRKMVNTKTNTLIKQKAVTPEFDFDAIKGIVDKYVENYDSSLEQKALNHIVENWDSIPKRIRDLKKQGTTKAKSTKKSIDTLANETLSAQPKQDAPTTKYSDRGYIETDSKAVMTNERIDYLIEDSGAGSRVDYANYWITSISPTDFINMTTTLKIQDRSTFDRLPSEWNDNSTIETYDYMGELKKNMRQTPYLAIDINTGEVVGHEGRHRIRALEKNGIKSVEIRVEFRDEDGRIVKYSPDGKRLQIKDAMEIINQFGTKQSATIENIIPLNKDYRDEILANYGETFAQKDDIRFSDRAYMDAVQSGDMETAQKMVDEAAKKAGYRVKGHHGTDVKFTVFNREQTSTANDFGQGFYFSSSQVEAERYQSGDTFGDTYTKIYGIAENNAFERIHDMGEDANDDALFTKIFNEEFDKELKRRTDEGAVISAYLKMDKPFIVSTSNWITEEEAIDIAKNTMYVEDVPNDAAIADWIHSIKTYAKQHNGKIDTDHFANKMGHAINLTSALLHQGKYDGILDYSIGEKFNSTSDYHAIALYPNQIKSSDPVTYDDNGNIIPLSERFNEKNEDIRYSDRDYRLNSRNLLANALESSVTNPTEREWLKKYKENIASLDADQKRLDEINAEIKKISFTKGSDRSKLTALNNNKKTLTARITRADKKLLDFEASKPLKNVLEAEKKRAVQRARDEARENLKAEKEKSAQNIRELMNRYTERIERSKEGRDKTAVRKKIRNVVSYLNSIFNRGTKERNVKLGLQDTVSRALATAEVLFSDEITNADIVRLGVESVTDKEMKYLEEYNNLLNQLDSAKDEDVPSIKAKISRLNSLLKNVFVREKARLNRQTVDYALSSLAEAYKDLKNSSDEYIKNNAFVEGMYDRIIGLKDDLKGVTIKDMSLEQLESVYKIYSMVKHMVTNANSIFRDGRAEDLATNISNVQAEIDAIPSSNEDNPDIIEKMKDPGRSFLWNELKPYYAFERLGSKTFEKLYWDVVEADGVWARDMEEAGDLIKESRKKHGYKTWDMETARTFKSSNGLDFKLTLGDMMSIYAYSKRPQAQDHMTIGGFVFDQGSTYKVKDDEKKKGLFKTYRHAKLSETYRVDPKLIGNVIAELEKIEGAKEYVDEMQSYLTQLGEKGNEVSRILFGIDLFREKVYFPLQSAKDYRSSVEQTLNATQTMASLKNTGVSKETVPHANNPIVLRSFDDVVLEHINTMSKYHAYVIPIENLSKVFNNVGKDAINGEYISTQALISSKFSKDATKYFDQFITDLNGGSFNSGATNPLAKLFGTARAVSVAANLSVVVQQYFAVIRAMDMIGPKYMIPFLNSEASKSTEKQWEELKKYAPIGIIKEIGGFDMGANRNAIDYLGDAETKMDAKKVGKKVKEGAMWLAGKMDEIGWSTIWRAVKKEIADTTTLDIGTEEFFQACGKRFTEIIAKTQVYDSVTSRSGYMRSKHESVKYLTSFLGEPTTIVNMMLSKQLKLARAIKSKDKKAIKEASLGLLRGSTVIILSTVLTSLAKSLPYAMRDDEDEEGALLERWAKHFGEATASDMNPLNMIPIGRDLVSIWEGWDVERPDMTLISDIFTAFKRAVEDGCDTDEALALAGALANILGYPLKNIIRDVKGFIRLFGDITDDMAPEDISGAFAEGFTD